jgi:hypothetical protein
MESRSAAAVIEVVDTEHGAMWQACVGGVCVRAHSGVQLLELYRVLLVSQGRPVPPG